MEEEQKVKIAKSQNVFLVGPVGAGKTTVGRFLARHLSREFYDTDEVIEERTGADVAWIFDIEGEEGFREREVNIIDELTQETGVVISTGGGAILKAENRTALMSRGVVIYLQVSVEQQLLRTEKDKKRPLLRTNNKESVLRQMCEERAKLYEEVADLTFPTDAQTARAVANKVLQTLQS